jgi:RimJ/RimL family protein N-acetyltransferase
VRNASREWLHDSSAYTLPEAVEWFRRGGGAQFLVIALDDVPIGYCRVADGNSASEKMVGMDLHPDYRGRGMARPAYAALFARLRAQGITQFRLRVLTTNTRARHIYDALGFVPVAAADAPYETSEVEMVLT